MKNYNRTEDEHLPNGSVICWSRKNQIHVPVICGTCGTERIITQYKTARENFTGLCQSCSLRRQDDEVLSNGSVIRWSRRKDPYVPVICGSCGRERMLEYTGVTREDFTGLCRDCVNNTKLQDVTLPNGSIIFWSRRDGYRVPVLCGRCGQERITHAASIRSDGFTGLCRRCVNTGPSAGNWRGGRVNRDGYVLVKVYPDHPFYEAMATKTGYIAEHRLVMAEHLGRPLKDTEVVHHKNGDKTDNRIENLELYVSFQEHGKALQERTPHPGHLPAKEFNRILARLKAMLRSDE